MSDTMWWSRDGVTSHAGGGDDAAAETVREAWYVTSVLGSWSSCVEVLLRLGRDVQSVRWPQTGAWSSLCPALTDSTDKLWRRAEFAYYSLLLTKVPSTRRVD